MDSHRFQGEAAQEEEPFRRRGRLARIALCACEGRRLADGRGGSTNFKPNLDVTAFTVTFTGIVDQVFLNVTP